MNFTLPVSLLANPWSRSSWVLQLELPLASGMCLAPGCPWYKITGNHPRSALWVWTAALVHAVLVEQRGGLGSPLPWVLWGSPTLRGYCSSLGFGGLAPTAAAGKRRGLLQEGEGLKTLGGLLIGTPSVQEGLAKHLSLAVGGSKVTLEEGFGLKCSFFLSAKVSKEGCTLTAWPHGGVLLSFRCGDPSPWPPSSATHPLHPTSATHLLPQMLSPPSHFSPPACHIPPPAHPGVREPPAHGSGCHRAGSHALPMAVGWEAMPHEVHTVLAAGSRIISGLETC